MLSRDEIAYTTAYVATATSRISRMISSDSDDDILASNSVLVRFIVNQKRKLSLKTRKN